ncbi:hypothetical protein [Pseudomonas fluorescens]|uniref:Guanine nucleotide exchange factor SopE GEF domain-containing protein n=1 Tax=Pseudomonas fluorescens TaxID=294 RepID=A0A5E7G8G5_PSEFL|nr:hypothetical protein [Pseudomonas fluorescens]VVO48149.1 hypothetical protein PS880_00157 [Pseudomonas fluorescens]
MLITSAAFNPVAPPVSVDVSSGAKPVGRVAAAVKSCANVPTQPPHAEKTQHGMFWKAMCFLGLKSGENPTKTTSLDTVDSVCAATKSADQSTHRMARGLKRSANVTERPIHIERRHRDGALCKVMHFLGLGANEVSSEKGVVKPVVQRSEPLTEAKRQEIKSAIQKEIENFNFEAKFKADPELMNQSFQMMYGAIFSRAQDSFGSKCAEIKVLPKEKKECSVALGSIAKEFGMDGKEKNGIFAPSCIGANGFVTMVLSPILISYGKDYYGEARDFNLFTEALIGVKLRSIALEQGRPDPQEFYLKLEAVLVENFPDYE